MTDDLEKAEILLGISKYPFMKTGCVDILSQRIADALRLSREEGRREVLESAEVKEFMKTGKELLHQAHSCGLDHGSLTFEIIEFEKSLEAFNKLREEKSK